MFIQLNMQLKQLNWISEVNLLKKTHEESKLQNGKFKNTLCNTM